MEHAKEYFDQHLTASLLHFTTDGLCFFDEAAAQLHGAKLPDKTVSAITRAEADNEVAALQESWDALMGDGDDEE